MKASIIIVLALIILQAVMSNILDWEQLLLKLFLVVMLIPSTLEKKKPTIYFEGYADWN